MLLYVGIVNAIQHNAQVGCGMYKKAKGWLGIGKPKPADSSAADPGALSADAAATAQANAINAATAVAVCTPPATDETIEPESALTSAYEDAYARYRSVYPAVSALGQ